MARMIDLHVHPTLKMYYLPYLRSTFHALTYSGGFWNPLSFRTRYGNLKDSPVKVMLASHYVIEQGFIKYGLQWFARGISWALAPTFYGRLRRADPWESLIKMMDTLEDSCKNSNRWIRGGKTKFRMVKKFSDFRDVQDDEIALVHAVEGSHALGYGPEEGESKEEFWKRVKKRLRILKDRGVSLITLAHFWDNMFCPQTDGTELIPRKKNGKVVATRDDLVFHMKRGAWRFGDKDHLAEEFVTELLDLGILIDVSHAQMHARKRIFDLCEKYNRPVVASHVGLQHFFDNEYNMSDEEIMRIHKLGGVIGLILTKRLLVDPLKRYKTSNDGIDDLIENMLYIKQLTGDVSCIGIGTDFDGLTHPFSDCFNPSQLHKIIEAMKKHFTEEEIDQIFYSNSLRVLENGWV